MLHKIFGCFNKIQCTRSAGPDTCAWGQKASKPKTALSKSKEKSIRLCLDQGFGEGKGSGSVR